MQISDSNFRQGSEPGHVARGSALTGDESAVVRSPRAASPGLPLPHAVVQHEESQEGRCDGLDRFMSDLRFC